MTKFEAKTWDEWEAEAKARPWWVKAYWSAYRGFWATFRYLRRDISNGVRGLLVWLPYAWKWRPWDYAYGLEAFELHLTHLEKTVREGPHTSAAKDSKEIRVALELLRRLRCDYEYWEAAGRSPAFKYLKTGGYKETHAKEKADWDYLWKLVSKRSQRWWS